MNVSNPATTKTTSTSTSRQSTDSDTARRSAQAAQAAAQRAKEAAARATKAGQRAALAKPGPQRDAARATATSASREATRLAAEATRAAAAASTCAQQLNQKVVALDEVGKLTRPAMQEAQDASRHARAAEAFAASARLSATAAGLAAQPPSALGAGGLDQFEAAHAAAAARPLTAVAPAALADQAHQAAGEAANLRQRAEAQILSAQSELRAALAGAHSTISTRLAIAPAEAGLALAREGLVPMAAEATAAAGRAEQAARRLEMYAARHPSEAAAQTLAEQARTDADAAQRDAAGARGAGGLQLILDANTPTTPTADLAFDGSVIGAGPRLGDPANPSGAVYGAGTDARSVAPFKPANGTASEMVYEINGIQDDAAAQARSAQALANRANVNVVAIHNATAGVGFNIVWDLGQCLMDKTRLAPATNNATARLAYQLAIDIRESRPIHLSAHSQGALVTSGALTALKTVLVDNYGPAKADAILSKIKVETFGGAAASYPSGPQYTHYINVRDPVPTQTGLGSIANADARQTAAGGSRATVHFIEDDARGGGEVMNFNAHDFNEGYLDHRMPFEQARADNAQLSGQSEIGPADGVVRPAAERPSKDEAFRRATEQAASNAALGAAIARDAAQRGDLAEVWRGAAMVTASRASLPSNEQLWEASPGGARPQSLLLIEELQEEMAQLVTSVEPCVVEG